MTNKEIKHQLEKQVYSYNDKNELYINNSNGNYDIDYQKFKRSLEHYLTLLNDEFKTFNVLLKDQDNNTKVSFEIEYDKQKFNLINNLGEKDSNLNNEEVVNKIFTYYPSIEHTDDELKNIKNLLERKVLDHTGIKRNDFVEEILTNLDTGIKNVYTSDNWIKWLDFNSKFYSYSSRNRILIYLQMPYATNIASMSDWNKKFERQIIKGEGKKGIKILAPIENKFKTEEKVKDKNGEYVIEDGKIKTETKEHKFISFIPVSVYDISQTQGKPVPTLMTELRGEVLDYAEILLAIEKTIKTPLIFEGIKGGAKGYFSENIKTGEKKVVIKEGMSEEQTIKTAIHEMTHFMLHNKDNLLNDDLDPQTKELQAESVAYLVCKEFNIDTSQYSFNYLASWSQGKENKLLQDNIDIIIKTSEQIKNELLYHMKKINLNICKNPLACEKYLKSSEYLKNVPSAETYNLLIKKVDDISFDNIFIEINQSDYKGITNGELYSHKQFNDLFVKADGECSNFYKSQNLENAYDKINFSVYYKDGEKFKKETVTYKMGTKTEKNYLDIFSNDKDLKATIEKNIKQEKSYSKNKKR